MARKRKVDERLECSSSISDSEYESYPDSEEEGETPISTPATPHTPRPSDLKTIQCPYDDCSKTFTRQARLNEHLRSHTNSRPFKCTHDGCTKDFLRESHLKHHVKSAHTNLRDYACTWQGCGKSFTTGTRLRRHEAAHQVKEKWRCRGYDDCNETFRKHDTLKRHIMMVHEQKKPYPCAETDASTGKTCTSAFDTAEKLRAHHRAKHDNSRFSCTECLQRQKETQAGTFADMVNDNSIPPQALEAHFATYTDLQLHIATVHPPTCSYCLASFPTSKGLSQHLELEHGAVDPDAHDPKTRFAFQCTYPDCGRSFSKRGNLNVHVNTVHQHRRDFICGQTELHLREFQTVEDQHQELVGCGRDFTSKSSLEEHVRTAHLGLGSKRMEREKKRKLARENSGTSKKSRKSRKGQGKKNTALATLTGLPEPSGTPQTTYSAEGLFRGATFEAAGGANDDLFRIYGYEAAQAYQQAHEQTGSVWPSVENVFYDRVHGTTDVDTVNTLPTAAVDPLLLLT